MYSLRELQRPRPRDTRPLKRRFTRHKGAPCPREPAQYCGAPKHLLFGDATVSASGSFKNTPQPTTRRLLLLSACITYHILISVKDRERTASGVLHRTLSLERTVDTPPTPLPPGTSRIRHYLNFAQQHWLTWACENLSHIQKRLCVPPRHVLSTLTQSPVHPVHFHQW